MSQYTAEQRRRILLVLTLLLGGVLIWMMRGLLSAFLGAIVIYVLFRPVFAFLVARWKWPYWVATLAVMTLSFASLVLPILVVGFMIAGKLRLLMDHPDVIEAVLKRIQTYLSEQFDFQFTAEKVAGYIDKYLVGNVSDLLNGVGSLLFTLSITYFLLWFIFMNHQSFERTLRRIVPFTREESDKFGDELRSSTFGNVLGQGFICFTQGVLLALGFWIFDISDPVFWGIITFFISFLPIVGAPLVFVPAGILELTYGDQFAGYGIMIWGFVLVTNIDNVLRYFISRYFADTHPLITILGVIVGLPVFGLLGLVFGPLLISWFVLLTRIVILKEEISD